MKYAKIIDGEVAKYSNKPTSKRTSNIWLNKDALKSEGWLPVDEQKPSLNPWESLGSRKEEVMATKVKITYEVKSLSLDDYKAKKIGELKKNASRTIDEQVPPYKQRNIGMGVYDGTKANQLVKKVKDVIAEVDEKEAAIMAAADYEAVDLVYTGIVVFFDGELDENGFPVMEDVI